MDQKVAENPFKSRGSELNNKRENAFIVITALFYVSSLLNVTSCNSRFHSGAFSIRGALLPSSI